MKADCSALCALAIAAGEKQVKQMKQMDAMEEWLEGNGEFPWQDREILRYLGYPQEQKVTEQVMSLIGEGKQELEQAARPRSVWKEYPLRVEGHLLTTACLKTVSKNLEKNLKDCEKVLLFGATLGSQVDRLLQRYARLQMSKAVILQASAAAMLETYCDWQNERLREEYKEKGWYLRPRFSPGYGDFPLECQSSLVSALELSKRIGVTLTDSLLMAPSKSVTAVIGLSKKPRVCTVQGCEVCGKKDCPYRR